jgi:hypothetical protein
VRWSADRVRADPGRRRALSLCLFAAALSWGAGARADGLETEWGGRIQSDLRFRLQDKSVGTVYDKVDLPPGVERNQNLLNLRFKARYGSITGVADVDIYVNGYQAAPKTVGDLSEYNKLEPFSFEPQSLYVEVKDLLTKGLDLRVGNQIVLWGVADQFNPTNNLNADDLRDPLLFGKQQGNFMVKADYWLDDDWSVSGVLVPIFKPALLPRSAALGVASVDRLPFTSTALRNRVEAESGFGAYYGYPTTVANVTPTLPDPTMDNMQFAYRIAGTIAEQDVAFSYYNGRTDFPQPIANHTRQPTTPVCNPNAPKDCTAGLLATDVTLAYPRMHVYGLNIAGEVNPLKWISEKLHGIGYRFEGALVVPQAQQITLTNDAITLGGLPQPAGEYDYTGNGNPASSRPNVVDATPFLKWTLGLDYTFGEHVYVNAQWVHGLADEYGAGDFMHEGWSVRQSGVSTTKADTLSRCIFPKRDGTQCATEVLHPRLGDYLVLGADYKVDERVLLRLFTIWDLSGYTMESWSKADKQRDRTHHSLFSQDGFSAVLFPEVDYKVGGGLELGLGALLLLGKDYTKFGDPAAGGSLLWTRARYSF